MLGPMDCPSCGAAGAAGARFCWSCGQPLRAPTEERRVVTVLFADLVGFTALSEHLDPEQVRRLVDHAFERLVRDVTSFGGRVDKIVGDAIVALFGAPVAHEDDAERAVRSGLRMQETLAAMADDDWLPDAGSPIGPDGGPVPALRMRIGINTGEVLVGALRAGGDYTAMGDVVNTASRLQTMAEPGEVLVGGSTHAATASVISYESRGALVPRGRDGAVPVFSAITAVQPPGYRPRARVEAPLVGRGPEMDALTDALGLSVARGRGQIVLIVGEAGVGKTRLADELAHVAAIDHGVAHFNGRCVPYGEANPWWPVAEALRAGCGVHRDDPLTVAHERVTRAVATACRPPDPGSAAPPNELTGDSEEAIVAGLLHLMGYEGPWRGLDGPAVRAEATHALVSFLEASLRHGPIMVRVSDLHWADQVVLDLIDEVAARLARCPFLLVATARGELQERWSPRAGRFNTLVLNLDPLDRTASAQLLDLLAGAELDPQRRSTLLDRSGGNPFYLEELVTLVGPAPAATVGDPPAGVPVGAVDDGSDRPGATGSASRSGPGVGRGELSGPASDAALPDTLRGLVAARIDGLGRDEQQVLEDAAVWGASGTVEVLQRIATAMRSGEDVTPVVRNLADQDVLVLDGEEWSFRSDLIREVAYGRLTKRERLIRHLGIAEFLDRKFREADADDGTVDTVTRHFVEAARLDRDLGRAHQERAVVAHAVRWALEAARRAESDASWELARRLYTQALDLLDDESDPVAVESRFRCLVGRSRVRSEVWDEAGARRDAADALELADSLGDPADRAVALLRLGTAAARAGDSERAEVELSESIRIFEETGDLQGQAEALREKGLAALLRGDSRGAEDPIAAALDAFRSVGDRRGEAWCLQNLAWIALSDGRPVAAAEFVAASEEAFREVGDRGGLSWAQGLAAFCRLGEGDLDAAGEIAGRILRESERRGDRFGVGMMLTALAHVELWQGRARAAAASAERAVTAFASSTELAGTVGLEQAMAIAGRAEIMAGNTGKGRHLLAEAVRSGPGGAPSVYASGVALVTDVQLGRPERVVALDPDLWSVAAGSGRRGDQDAALALALAQSGRVAEAVRRADAAVGTDPDHGYVVACAALVAAAAGDHERARERALRVLGLARATYLDRVWARIVLALVGPGEGGVDQLDLADGEIGPGEDVVAVALVDLARLVLDARGEDRWRQADGVEPRGLDLGGSEVGRRLWELGLDDTRWADLFVAAVTAGDLAAPAP